MENVVYFKMKNESHLNKIPIQGVYIQIKDLRVRIKEQLRIQVQDTVFNNNEELLLQEESEQMDKALCLADKVRVKQTVVVTRQPAQQNSSLCRSCFYGRQNQGTPCCSQPICSLCASKFIQQGKCFFNMNSQCQYKYVNYTPQTISIQNEISIQELDSFIKNAVFFIVKSNNEQNVNLAKQYNCWATTRKNFSHLQNEFNKLKFADQKVILIFTANRAERFLGCARMINTFTQRDPKWQWHATASIQLADNFEIKWLRKGSVDFSKLQDTMNPNTGEQVTKSRDCQQIPADIGQRICMLFEQIKSSEEDQQQEIPPIMNFQQPQTYQQQIPVQQPQTDDWDLDKIITEQPQKQPTPPPIQQEPVSPSQSSSRSASPAKSGNLFQQAMMQQICQPMLINQQMETNWMSMNRGKIPGLTGKVQYPHPFLQRMAQQQTKSMEQFLNQIQSKASVPPRSRSKSVEKKSKKKDRSTSYDKDKKKSKKNKDHKDKSKKKKRSHSRGHKKSKKH